MKKWKLTYSVLYVWEDEPKNYTMEFIYLETLLRFIKDTEKDANQFLISFSVEKLDFPKPNEKANEAVA